jgi:SulP family sulfate permease
LGSTFFGVIAGYAEALEAAGGRLYLSGVQDDMVNRFHRSQVEDVQGRIKIFNATEVLGASTLAAVEDAKTWLVGEAPDAADQEE